VEKNYSPRSTFGYMAHSLAASFWYLVSSIPLSLVGEVTSTVVQEDRYSRVSRRYRLDMSDQS